jgi:hypothetical protein
MKTDASGSVVKVGEGRGFVVEYRQEWPPFEGKRQFTRERVVITAAHCLPQIPQDVFDDEGKLYKNLLGLLDDRKRGVWAECLFVDPVSDIAILGTPHLQDLSEKHEAFLELMNKANPVRISRLRMFDGRALVLSLKGEWLPIQVHYGPGNRRFWIEDSSPLQPGMTGSPIMTKGDTAIGLLSTAADHGVAAVHPLLAHRLPGWLALQAR